MQRSDTGMANAAAKDERGQEKSFQSHAPSVDLPKGGGSIKGIGEKFAANPVTGTGSMSVPLASSPGRSGIGPQLTLSYDSGGGNGPFGFGWNLGLPAVTRKTDKGLPRYLDASESDVFILSCAEDLVPEFRKDPVGSWVSSHPGHSRSTEGDWVLDPAGRQVVHEDVVDGYRIRRYRPRTEGLFARIERWSSIEAPSQVHWRSITQDNLLTCYGLDAESRIADPANPDRIFSWLLSETRDAKGNVVVYRYKAEDGAGADLATPHQHNRGDTLSTLRSANRYLKRIFYGNRTPLLDSTGKRPRWPETKDIPKSDWMFEVVFDYGEHSLTAPSPSEGHAWPHRNDAFSSYRPGFEIRTARRCRRVLMFHHFQGEADVGLDCLVRSTDLHFDDTVPIEVRGSACYSFLKKVVQTGYRRAANGYTARSLPPVEFDYSVPTIGTRIDELATDGQQNLPVGLDGKSYRWTDLHGEGIPGILTEQAGTWYYKRNLSPLESLGTERGVGVKARFAPTEQVRSKPNVSLAAGAELMDLAGDGHVDVVQLDGQIPGYFEHDDSEGWEPFRPLQSRLLRDLQDPNLKFIDLDGDGHADILISEDDAFIWHASLAEEGFGPAQRVLKALDEEKGPRVVFADGTQTIHLADMSGDGLTDIVRIRNGEVSYWPHLGYGRFGAKVTMDHSPRFDLPDQFDPQRLRLADIDGSGTTDLIYLHREGVRLYFNQSGNGWSQEQGLPVFPPVDALTTVTPVDLLGNGTACLVWSSPLAADAGRTLRYVKLMGDQKPHLLVRSINNLGAETRVHYAPSTKFYLQDKLAGKQWITRLPFPVHVVERLETFDHISRNRFVSRYAYHHGHFDGEEREFRGFGMVEQWDTEQLASLTESGCLPVGDNIDAASHVPPVHTRTWYHTGAFLGRDRVSRYFAGLLDGSDAGEYYREPGLTDAEAAALLLPDTRLPEGLTPAEAREACRALKGSMLRQETYADDANGQSTAAERERSRTPYTVVEQNFALRRLQPCGQNRHAVFHTHSNEVLTYHYERDAADPRTQHALTLEVDDYGTVLKQVAIGYGRRTQVVRFQADGLPQRVPNPALTALAEPDRLRQTETLVTYTETSVARPNTSLNNYRGPVACEVVTFELTGYLPTDSAARFRAIDFVERHPAPAPTPAHSGYLRLRFDHERPYEAPPKAGRCRRPIEWLRTYFRSDDLTRILPLGMQNPLGLPGEAFKLAFTSGLLTQAFSRDGQALLPDAAAVLASAGSDGGGYVSGSAMPFDATLIPDRAPAGAWWVPSGRSFFSHNPADTPVAELAEARRHFFQARRHRDPFGQDSHVDFDAHDLLISETRDALGNRVTVLANDYRVLQPCLIRDPNGNRSAVAFDTLGMVAGTAVMGKAAPAPLEGDTLTGFEADLMQAQLDTLMAAPRQPSADDPQASEASPIVHDLLQGATTRIVYDLDRYQRLGEPPFAATIARETHVSDLPKDAQGNPTRKSKLQLSFSYSDGFGREIQKKIQAEPGRLDPNDPQSPHVNPRWVGSGWTIFNNKGKPVRQYEPFFSATHGFQFDAIHGVSPVLFYDPAERVIATLHPNHTYEKVVFDPWQQTTYDVNDTVADYDLGTGTATVRDPSTDTDVGGFFARLPANDYLPTWFELRTTAALALAAWPDIDAAGTPLPYNTTRRKYERQAAAKAAAHANTPTTAHFDALGRPFLTVARNRVVCADHDLNGHQDNFATRVELDIEGNQRSVRDAITHTEARDAAGNSVSVDDPLGRVVMRYAYDMLGHRIRQISMEAGTRWMLNDVAGKPIRAWDSRGHNFATKHDALRRPVEQYVRGTFSDADPLKPNSDPRTLNRDILVDKIEYGESLANAEALNLRTRIYRHCDSAGVATNAGLDAAGNPTQAYDFKGNLLRSTRQLVSDYTAIPDWQLVPKLDNEFFEGSTRYDALNRPIQSVAPRSSLERGKFNVIQPVFNEANLLDRVDVWLDRAASPGALLDPAADAASAVGVANIDYDAKGQRERVDYKNGASTFYRYDPLNFRLIHLLTKRKAADFPGDAPQPPLDPAWPGKQVQNLHYTYDPAGNITHIHDDAQQTIYFSNQRVDPSNDYVYDALYRLIQATGREHLGQAGGAPMPHSHDDAGRVGLLHPGDGNAMGRYIERYVVDAVGNFLQMQHRGSDPAHAGWTRGYTYLEPSLTEDGNGGAPLKPSNRLTRTTLNPAGNTPQPETYQHDAHGNMLRMPHLGGGLPGPNMHWDYKDQLRQIDRGAGSSAFYVYDAAGQRVRKVWEKAPGLTEERIYLGGFEIFRKHDGPIDANTATLERETLHVMDDKQRIALVETRTLPNTPDPDDPLQLIRYQFGNHLGSASLEMDDQAQIISYEEYAPYGGSTYQAARSQTETAKQYRYTGAERDSDNGLYYYGARYYAPWLGRWAKPDPAGIAPGPNLYLYCRGDPIGRIDVEGNWDVNWKSVAKGALVASAVIVVAAVVVASAGTAAPIIAGAGAGLLGASAATTATVVAGTTAAVEVGTSALALYGVAQTGVGVAEVATGRESGSGRKLSDEERSEKLGEVGAGLLALGIAAKFKGGGSKGPSGQSAPPAPKLAPPEPATPKIPPPELPPSPAPKATPALVEEVAQPSSGRNVPTPEAQTSTTGSANSAPGSPSGTRATPPPAPKNPHGNSLDSSKLHHVYEIIDTKTGTQHKTGISGRPLNKNGTSPRANQQLNKLNAKEPGRYQARIVAEDLPNRRAALTTEQHFVNIQNNTTGGVGPGQSLPKPNAMFGPLAR